MDKELKKELLKTAMREERESFERSFKWLEESMSDAFFKEVDPKKITLIVHSLMGFKVQEYFSQIHLKNAAIVLCLDGLDADISILSRYSNQGIKSYTTYVSTRPFEKRNLRIAILHFFEGDAIAFEKEDIAQRDRLKQLFLQAEPSLTNDAAEHYLKRIDPSFLHKMASDRQVVALQMLMRAETRDTCQYDMQKSASSMHLVLAWKNVTRDQFLYRLARAAYRHKLHMTNLNALYIDPFTTHSILMLSFELHQDPKSQVDIADFLQELATLKYFISDDAVEEKLVEKGLITGNIANFLRAAASFIHQVLVNVDANFYSLEHIEEDLTRHSELTVKLCKAFEYKFHPIECDLELYEKQRQEFYQLVEQIDTGQENYDIRRKNVLFQGMNFVHNILKTNFYQNNKAALAFRLDPEYLNYAPFDRNKIFPELPFAIFYFKGMHYLGFHVRFKDLARGGLRTVFPEKKERMLAERDSAFLECYSLALTQHKKNKDIPEGGAKGVIFLQASDSLVIEANAFKKILVEAGFWQAEIEIQIDAFMRAQRQEYLYQTQRSYINSFLSLINCDERGKLVGENILDYWNKPEYIYLGPDENMHDSMIEWIARESHLQKYKCGGAFITGKPLTGINHKEYGVTSLGVNVYLQEVLKFLGIEAHKTPFTVKMTGGPDGDVAGNQICNLFRDYPKTAKLVALTDVSGTIHDPQGLDLETAVSLFKQGRSIRFYPPEMLSEGGFLLDRETKKEIAPYVFHTLFWQKKEGKLLQKWLIGNEMNALFRHNVHQTVTDIFIPCGGRPRTLNESNIQEFLDSSLNPTSKAIIEGANLYLSSGARKLLEEKGVLIIKDSSANKAGVISSSFEVLCGLILSDEEFVKYKPKLVEEILERLRIVARAEAKLLLTTRQERGIPLTEISEQISEKINFYKDELLAYFERVSLKDVYNQCFINYMLKTLREKFLDRLIKEIPDGHKKAIIASHIATHLVYSKGLQWHPSLVDILPLILEEFKSHRV